MKYYLFGGMSAAFLLFGFSYLYGISRFDKSPRDPAGDLCMERPTGATPLLYVALVMIVAGLGFKVAAVPFHLWAPDTYEGAPAPAAAFIASVSKVASFALLISIAASALMSSMDVHFQLRSCVCDSRRCDPLARVSRHLRRLADNSDGVLRRLHGAGKPGSSCSDERAPAACLLRHRACRLHPARACLLLAFDR